MFLIDFETLKNFINSLINQYEIYAPIKKRDEYIFEKISNASEVVFENYIPTVLPPKKFLLPNEEKILKVNYKTKEAQPIFESKEFIIFGVRPCDLTAIYILDQIEADGNADPYYLERRKNAIIIGYDCEKSCDENALCNTVGSINPPEKSYDIFISKMNNNYVLIASTEKGKELVKNHITKKKNMDTSEIKEFNEKRAERITKFNQNVKYVFQDVTKIFEKHYNDPYWDEIGKKCLMCGSCIMVCPTCYCFAVEHEIDLKLENVYVKRRWDGCLLRDFSLVAGGHNFRPTASMRLKHRWNRKFNYLFKKYKISNCVGCGRCGRACLVNINPIDILNNIMKNHYSEVKK